MKISKREGFPNLKDNAQILYNLIQEATKKYVGQQIDSDTIEKIKSSILIHLEGNYDKALIQKIKLDINVTTHNKRNELIVDFLNLEEYLRQFI